MIKKIIDDKRFLTIYAVVIFSLVLGITYALGTYSIGLNIATAVIGADARVYGSTMFDSSDLDFKPILDTEVETNTDNVIKIDFTVGGASTNNITNVIYDIALADLEVDCNLLSPYVKWKLVNNTTSTTYTGSLDYKFDTIKNGRLVLTSTQEDLPVYSATKTDYHSYTFYMWFSDSCQESDISLCGNYEDQSNLVGKSFSGKVEVELYTENKKPLVRQPSDTLKTSTCNNTGPVFVNAPNLDNNNLIPVYYDDNEEVWKKADSNNKNYSWYDYGQKRWANAIIVSNDTKSTYQSADVGTTITDSDIIAFYVWIPRYKYRVWNITRQGGEESTYAYKAYSKGIEIEFEQGTASTGNVECDYDITLGEPENEEDSVLSDNCYYNGSDTAIATTDSNKSYANAWYTHPAFTFGEETDTNKQKTGFWIGKFETSGTIDDTELNVSNNPKILPNVSSLRKQTVSSQFTTSKKFQNYLSSDSSLDAHMLTNLEWGAVAYLTHSNYGLCYEGSCKGVNHNNSSGFFTGRSGGAIAGSTDLNLANVYPDDSTDTTQYNSNGYYTYKGYFIDYSGNITTTKDITKVASTTGNITGVYDMSGGAYEYVMGNKLSSSYAFYPSAAGTSWNGSSTLGSQYYNAYSYGTSTSDAKAFNRARLGDATAEVLGGTSSRSAWKVGSGITGSNSYFVGSSNSWFNRGGDYSNSNSGAFSFRRSNGISDDYLSSRSSLS